MRSGKMEKITVLILVLGLSVPAQAWHLFPVKEKPVIENKVNSVSSGVREGIACLIGLGVGIFVGLFVVYKSSFKIIRNEVINEINIKLKEVSLEFCTDSVLMGRQPMDTGDDDDVTLFPIPDTAPIRTVVGQQFDEYVKLRAGDI
jgi:hypothetical protein